MDSIIAVLLQWGLLGLLVAAFTESFCSPVLPDLILIPLALARPEHAIYYGLMTTAASVVGGLAGYWIGHRVGLSAIRKVVPAKYEEKIRSAVNKNAKWAIFVAAMSPIPYKFVCISAGALRVSLPTFVIVSFLGRGKRFLLEGILIYYYGPKAEHILTSHTTEMMFISLALVGLVAAGVYVSRRMKADTATENG